MCISKVGWSLIVNSEWEIYIILQMHGLVMYPKQGDVSGRVDLILKTAEQSYSSVERQHPKRDSSPCLPPPVYVNLPL